MWAPADLFRPAVDALLFPAKRATSYLYENPMVLAALILAVAALIAAVAMIGGRRARPR